MSQVGILLCLPSHEKLARLPEIFSPRDSLQGLCVIQRLPVICAHKHLSLLCVPITWFLPALLSGESPLFIVSICYDVLRTMFFFVCHPLPLSSAARRYAQAALTFLLDLTSNHLLEVALLLG